MAEFKLSEKKLYKPFSNDLENLEIFSFLRKILRPEKNFFYVAIIYGVAVSILSLATPLSVQLLINSVSFTALAQPIAVLGVILLVLLIFSGILNALQIYVAELFQRRFFARTAAEIALKLIKAKHSSLEESNSSELVNRFFDVSAIQKIVPRFLTESFSLVLQTAIGLLLVACYHPALLVFSIIIIASIYLIWRFFGRKAIKASLYESRRKYDVAAWLEDIGRSNNMFKSEIGQNYAKYKVDFLTSQYLKERKQHFRQLFSQIILLLALYAISSAALLVIGGWLVLKGQLTIGQLVASELVLSTILYGISKFGKDFDNFYDLASACEKLSQFYNIPEEVKKEIILKDEPIQISLNSVSAEFFNRKYFFNLTFEAGKNYIVSTEGSSVQKFLINFLGALDFPDSGTVDFNNQDVTGLNINNLRSKIITIDNSNLLEGTIEEYLTFNNKLIKKSRVLEVLKITEFDKVMLRLGLTLESRIIPSGWPFSETEKILLKVARTILLEPKVIIITEVLDMLGLDTRRKVLRYLTKSHQATIIYFSNRRDDMMDFDKYVFVDHETSTSFLEISDLDEFEKKYFSNHSNG